MAMIGSMVMGSNGAKTGTMLGIYTKRKEIKANNNAIKSQMMGNLSQTMMQTHLSNLAAASNRERGRNIEAQMAMEIAEAKRGIDVQERQAMSEETIRRGEGITAGASVERSVNDIIRQGTEAKSAVETQAYEAKRNLNLQVYKANEAERFKIIDSYNNLINQNTALAAGIISGGAKERAVWGAAIEGGSAGQEAGSSIGSFGSSSMSSFGSSFGSMFSM